MDVGRAFTYVTEDPEWVKKVLLGGVIFLVSVLFSIILIGLLGICILYGYYLEVIRRVHAGTPTPLPEWDDFGGYLTRGLAAAAGVIIWTLPIYIITGCIVFAASAGDSGTVLAVVIGCFAFPLYLAIGLLVFPVVLARYAVTGEFSSMFAFGEIASQVRRGFVPLLITFVVGAAAEFVAGFGFIACGVGLFFTAHYAYLVYAYMIGEMYRQVSGTAAPAPSTF